MLRKCLLLSLLFVFSCEISLEPDTRIVVSGKVLDTSGNPIDEATISVYIRRNQLFSSSENYLLGRNNSDSNGVFQVVSLFSKDEDFVIEVKAGNMYSQYAYVTNTETYTPFDLIFQLNEVQLKNTSKFTYNINRTSSSENVLNYSFTFKSIDCVDVYENENLNATQSYCNTSRIVGTQLNDNKPDISDSFITLLNTEVTFSYTLNNEQEISETFLINEDNYEFNFNY